MKTNNTFPVATRLPANSPDRLYRLDPPFKGDAHHVVVIVADKRVRAMPSDESGQHVTPALREVGGDDHRLVLGSMGYRVEDRFDADGSCDRPALGFSYDGAMNKEMVEGYRKLLADEGMSGEKYDFSRHATGGVTGQMVVELALNDNGTCEPINERVTLAMEALFPDGLRSGGEDLVAIGILGQAVARYMQSTVATGNPYAMTVGAFEAGVSVTSKANRNPSSHLLAGLLAIMLRGENE